MNPSRLAGSALLTAVLLFPLSGCARAIKQAYYEFRGAQSEIMLISGFAENTLTPYRSLHFEPATTTVGNTICPPRLLRCFDQYLAEAAADLRRLYPGGQPGLRITNEVLYSQRKGLLSQAMCLARVRMYDAEDQHLVVDAIILTESKSFRQGGRSDLAASTVKALHQFLRRQQPPDNSLLVQL